uniref:Plastid lipid-associated protein/fibrillin conserved domain-containing protein n=1 Tax=Craspedostauros australis TaxID=1486917 RepID=A0A7R9WR40_9STRA|mmetsp:Transcript_15532/g.42911  ORF Transcript_15532/g.42911 Transcript_15532/m.42911 type:complete len:329 (+) Transcript_15532:113-1099(+)
MTSQTFKSKILLLCALAQCAFSWVSNNPQHVPTCGAAMCTTSSSSTALKASTWFGTTSESTVATASTEMAKAQILQLGAALDRGQSYNPTSGEYYGETMQVARQKIEGLLEANPDKVPTTLEDIQGEWELVLSTVPHGIFRSSPFFLAIQDSYEYAEEKEINGEPKANLFFRLHELQTCSWGVSKIGRVAQRIDPVKKYLYSEFDTSIFSLTVIPILGWFKLLPTFGGCVVTAATCEMKEEGELAMVVDYTTSRKVPGLSGLPLVGDIIWKLNVPVGAIWKLLPWNKGREATCKVFVKYVDDDFRIVQDGDGEYFVYTRPVVPRELDI